MFIGDNVRFQEKIAEFTFIFDFILRTMSVQVAFGKGIHQRWQTFYVLRATLAISKKITESRGPLD